MGSQLAKFTMSPIIASTVMSSKDHKGFEIFTHFGPSRFNSIISNDPYDLLIDYREISHNLGLLKLHDVTYTTY